MGEDGVWRRQSARVVVGKTIMKKRDREDHWSFEEAEAWFLVWRVVRPWG